jgi:hypothetical protein
VIQGQQWIVCGCEVLTPPAACAHSKRRTSFPFTDYMPVPPRPLTACQLTRAMRNRGAHRKRARWRVRSRKRWVRRWVRCKLAGWIWGRLWFIVWRDGGRLWTRVNGVRRLWGDGKVPPPPHSLAISSLTRARTCTCTARTLHTHAHTCA